MSKRAKAGTSTTAAQQRKRLFIEAYIANGRNATQAAITAGYSEKTAYSQGGRLLKDVEVAAEIQRRTATTLAIAEDKTLLTAYEVLQDMAQAKRFDPALMYDAAGKLLPVKDMPPEVRLHLEGIEQDEILVGKGEDRQVIGMTTKVRFPKKTAIREQTMKHFGLFERDNAQQPQAAPPMFVIVPVRAGRVVEGK